jgi:hypothetical protein
MTTDHIVEVYSAGNIVEAQALAEVLEEAGVAARVVGDMLGNAAGLLPPTSASPRVWVRAADETRAQEIVAMWLREPQATVAAGAPSEMNEEAVEPPESEQVDEPASPGRTLSRFVNRAIAISGVASVLAGTYFAMEGWLLQRRFSARTEAQYVDYGKGGYEKHPVADAPDMPGHVRFRTEYRLKYRILYAYEVNGQEYYAQLTDATRPPETMTVHYDPSQPGSNVVGPLTPPWLPLLLGSTVGAMLFFVAWRFR